MQLSDIAKTILVVQEAPVISIPAVPYQDMIDLDGVGEIKVTKGPWANDCVTYGFDCPFMWTREELITQLRRAIEILEILPDVSSLEEFADALGTDLETLL